MKQASSPSREATEVLYLTIIDEETLELSTRFGNYTLKSSGPMSSISLPQEIDLSGSVVLKLMALPATVRSSPPAMSAPSLSPSWTALLTKYYLAILISLSLWAILLYGLLQAGPVSVSFGVLLCLAAIALVATRSSPHTTRPPSSGNGPTDQPPSSTY